MEIFVKLGWCVRSGQEWRNEQLKLRSRALGALRQAMKGKFRSERDDPSTKSQPPNFKKKSSNVKENVNTAMLIVTMRQLHGLRSGLTC